MDGKDDGSPPILTVNCPIVQLALTVPTVLDRLIQQAVMQVLQKEEFLGIAPNSPIRGYFHQTET